MATKRHAIIATTLLLGVAIVAGILYFTLRQPPQMGADEDVFRTVDALYTAVTARNEKLLDQCDARLQKLKDAGKLPASAAAHLDGVIVTARAGRWQLAAERLYRFMEVQRRDK